VVQGGFTVEGGGWILGGGWWCLEMTGEREGMVRDCMRNV